MLELHQRAIHLPTEPPLNWLSFVQGRFLGELPGRREGQTVAIAFKSAVQRSEETAELRGTVEFSSGGALPVVYDCTGTLHLLNREVMLEDAKANRYEGAFSENGRVLSLLRHAADGARSKPFHLIETGTLRRLL